MSQRIDLKNKKFGRWTVLNYAETRNGGRSYWLCECDCGTVRKVATSHLRSGNSTSCGCISIEKHTKHGGAKRGSMHELYPRWTTIKDRCFNKKDKDYPNYGGRGIGFYEKWLDFNVFINDLYDSFLKFKSTDPPNIHLDRINNSGNYEPNNVRWVTAKQNNNNKGRLLK